MALEAGTFNFFGAGFAALLVLYATRDLRFSPALLGIILAMGGVGAIIDSLLTGWATRRFGLGHALLGGYILACAAPIAIPLAQGSHGVVVVSIASAYLIEAVGLAVTQVHVSSLRQCIVPLAQFGRRNAAYRFFVSGMSPLGALFGGFCGASLGLRPTLLLCGLGFICALNWVMFSPLPRLREAPMPAQGASDERAQPDLLHV